MSATLRHWGICLAAVVILLSALPAQAVWDLGGVTDEDYVSNYFGTTLLLITNAPVVDSNTSYWTELLPSELQLNQEYLVGFINAQRVGKGTPLLDAASYPIALGWETLLEDGRYQYHIDFTGIRPSEVEALVTLVGGSDKLLPGATLSIKPLSSGYFYGYASGTSIVTFMVGSQELSLDTAQSIAAAREEVAALLLQRFGHAVPFSLSLTQDYNSDGAGSVNASASLSVNLEPAYDG
jgi:hypothetical protein